MLCLLPVLSMFLVSAPGCKKDDLVNSTMSEIDGLADEIVETVKKADDKKAGVAEAQKLLDGKKEDLSAKMTEVGELRGFQVSEDVAGKMSSSISDSMIEVQGLKIDLMSETMKDPELDKALEKLTDDFTDVISP